MVQNYYNAWYIGQYVNNLDQEESCLVNYWFWIEVLSRKDARRDDLENSSTREVVKFTRFLALHWFLYAQNHVY